MADEQSGRRRFLRLGLAGAVAGLGGCQVLGSGGGSSIPSASFTFEYDRDGGQQGGSLRVTHDGGDGIRAGRLSVRSSGGHDARWSELGSTDVAADATVTTGDAARLDATVVNWPADVGFDERTKILYEYGETTSTLDQYTPGATPVPTPTQPPTPTQTPSPSPTPAPTVVESFESGSLSRYTGSVESFEVSGNRSTEGSSSLRSRSTVLATITTSGERTPRRGDTVRTDVYFGGEDGRLGIFLFVNADREGYLFDIENVDGVVEINDFSPGKNTTLADSTVDIPSGEWLTSRAETSATRLTHVLEDSSGRELVSVGVTDDRYSADGFGIAHNSTSGSGWVYVDNVRVD
jgi:hypothetical protein